VCTDVYINIFLVDGFCFFKRTVCITGDPAIVDHLINRSENELFKKFVTHGYLHRLLPPYHTSDLRNRGHLFQLPEYATGLHKKSFIIRILHKYV